MGLQAEVDLKHSIFHFHYITVCNLEGQGQVTGDYELEWTGNERAYHGSILPGKVASLEQRLRKGMPFGQRSTTLGKEHLGKEHLGKGQSTDYPRDIKCLYVKTVMLDSSLIGFSIGLTFSSTHCFFPFQGGAV